MKILRANARATRQQPATSFTGVVYADEVVVGEKPSRMRATRVSFTPGARTNWHSHEGGQVIHIEKGNMLAQEAGGPIKEYVPRQTMTTAPGVKHWHGALPNQPLTQVAMSFGTTNWMEKVTDAQYSAGAKK